MKGLAELLPPPRKKSMTKKHWLLTLEAETPVLLCQTAPSPPVIHTVRSPLPGLLVLFSPKAF